MNYYVHFQKVINIFNEVFFKIKADIVVSEYEVFNYLFSQVECGDYRFHKIEIIVEPNSQILPIGYPYIANIYPAIIDSTICHSFEIEGTNFPMKQGKGFYSFKVTENPGIYEKTGYINMENLYDSTIQKIPFKIEYEVLEKK